MRQTSHFSSFEATKPSTAAGLARRAPRHRALKAALCAAAFALCLGDARFARADDEAQAEALVKEGTKLRDAGKLDEACPKLEQAYKLAPNSGRLMHVAICHEKQGKIATAWTEYIDAEGEARKEGRPKVEADAKAFSKKLEGKLPRATLNVPEAAVVDGLEISIDGVVIEKSNWKKSRPLDPGEHKVLASAPGKLPAEQTVSMKAGDKKTITIPALEKDPNAGTAAAAHKPQGSGNEAKTGGGGSGSLSVGTPETKPDETPKEPEKPAESMRKAGRIVVELGAMGGILGGLISESQFTGLNSYFYTYVQPQGEEIAACTDKEGINHCHGIFDPSFGFIAGGQVFVGYALSESTQAGVRIFGGPRFGGGHVIMGGPSLSLRLEGKPLWVGGSLLIGSTQQLAPLVDIAGDVPSEYQKYNNNKSEVRVAKRTDTPTEDVAGAFALALSGDISYILLDKPSTSIFSGALMVNASPMIIKSLISLESIAFALPVGISYKFY